MALRSEGSRSAGTGSLLDREGLSALYQRLASFRVQTTAGASGPVGRRMLPFIQGLRFSAELIYEIRRLLPSTEMAAHWGHLLKGDDVLCSPECDIILHTDGKRRRWNGDHPEPVFDFWFIDPAAVRAVISCKSVIKWPSDLDRQFRRDLDSYGVKCIWLFAECCPSGGLDRIAARAKAAGYQHFFHLYTLDPNTGAAKPSEDSWRAFVSAVRKLDRTSSKRK